MTTHNQPDKRHKAAQRALASLLGVEFEKLPFIFREYRKRALKIGIHLDILERYPNAAESALSLWLAKWTGSTSYLERIAEGTNRHDLDGNDCGVISDNERLHAVGRLKRRAEKMAQKPQRAA